MVRVKRGKTALKRRKELLSKTKGYLNARSKKERAAREAFLHAGKNAFAHRRRKKGDFRRLWNIRIGAGLEQTSDISYSSFIHYLKKNNIHLNRKMLSEIAQDDIDTFKKIVDAVSS